jgi:hypothetical protein
MAKIFQKDTNGTLTNGLVSYYKMEGDSTDFWGTNNGTDTAVTYGTAYGKIGQGASFNGSTSQINLPKNSGTYPTGNTWSMSAWVYFNGTGGSAVYQFGNAYFVESLSSTGFDYRYYDGSADRTLSVSKTITTGWHHFVWTHDRTVGGIAYLDGVNVGTNSYTTSNSPSYSNVFIGREGSPSGNIFFNGYIDEFGIWNRALSTTEISDLYNGGAGNTMIYVAQSGAAFLYEFLSSN